MRIIALDLFVFTDFERDFMLKQEIQKSFKL